MLVLIVLLIAVAAWVDFSKQITILNPFDPSGKALVDRNVEPKLGLDLRGGLQVLLEADLPADQNVSADSMRIASKIVENRTNALGVGETNLTIANNRIVAEFPGAENSDEIIANLQKTGLLEFVDPAGAAFQQGQEIVTDYQNGKTAGTTDEATQTTVYHTIMAGTDLKNSYYTTDQTGLPAVGFELSTEGTKIFSDFTSANVGNPLAIVLDKKVISAPNIKVPITDGTGIISGSFTNEEANAMVVQLRYGSLPIPLKVAESRSIGPTLGADSVRRSLIAGIIGLSVVILFMILYYRLPGFLADLALITYALISMMIFKLVPVVLTLPGIAGFILSIGMAVDANILIFERLKEELRSGKNLRQAIELGWSRAWPSIRDSNISTLLTCLILYIFGNTFGASLVKGFSVTLALGVLVSLFTAITVTRTFLHVTLDNVKFAEHPRWFGL
jgi:preprotein translocase subunit SecD